MYAERRRRVAIVDYQLANMFSVERACVHIGLEPVITADPAVIASSDAVILPGVGAFGEAMANLRQRNLVEPLREAVASGKPFLGICLGMQLLLSRSDEFGESEGLGIVPGRVVRFPATSPAGTALRVPQIGWNRICRPAHTSWDRTPLARTASGEHMYFLHSFYAVPDDDASVLCTTTYEGIDYCSGVARSNVFGLQFHPEKSAGRGMDIYQSFASLL